MISFAISVVFTIYWIMINPLIPLFVWWIIQLIKVCIDIYTSKKLTRASLRSAWWFPSTHSWIAASVSVLMLINHGLYSSEFLIAIYFSFLFWYDAANIRYQAWQHASFINKIHEELEKVVILWDQVTYLKERLWHTFFEVLWWIIVWGALTVLLLLFFDSTLLYS